MTLRPADDTIQQRFLPVLSPQQRQNQFGLSGRGARSDSETQALFEDEDDVVEIKASESRFDGPRAAFNAFSYGSGQNFGGYAFGRNAENGTPPDVAASIYQKNEQNVDKPFYLGGGLDFVA